MKDKPMFKLHSVRILGTCTPVQSNASGNGVSEVMTGGQTGSTALTLDNAALKARAEKAEADLAALVEACRTLLELPWWLERLHDKINRRQALADLYMQELSGLRNWSEKVTALLARAGPTGDPT